MRHSIIIYSILIFCLGFIPGTPGTFNATDYGQEWQSVDSLESIGLYRQALKKVDEIYEKSKRGHQSGDELKALIFKLRFIHVLSEDGYQEIIRELSKDLEDDRVVIKSIKTSMLAELYLRYYQNNRWSIFKNKGFTDQGSENLETWSPSQFGKIIDSLYQESINSPDLLAGISLSEYQKVLQDSLRGGGNPTVLDLLSNRALDFYQQDELDYSVDPLPQFLMDSMVFSPKDEFLLWLRRQTIGDSFFSKSLAIHSIIINHHLEDIAEGDLLNSDLKRLTNSYRTYMGENGDRMYLEALDHIIESNEIDSLRAEVLLKKADFFDQRYYNYKINSSDTAKYIHDRRQSYLLAKQVMDLSPKSGSALKAQNLINKISAPQLKVSTQTVVFPNRHIPISIEYRNMEELWYWITPVSPLTTLSSGLINADRLPDIFVEGNSPVSKGRFHLTDRKDYNSHRVIVDLPPLLEGNYQLLITSSSDPQNETDLISLSHLRVSDLSWMSQVQDDGQLLVHIVDRGSGNPIEGISAKQYYRDYGNRQREERFIAGALFQSNRDGEILIPSDNSSGDRRNNSSFYLLFGSDDTGIILPDSYYNSPRINYKELRPSQRIFTDRGIYRPGQEVLFSGLLVIEDNNKLKADKNKDLEVLFQNANYKAIDTLKIRTNDFGFFSGSFSIPPDVMSGRFQLVSQWGRHIIQVEQYKRPAFNINIDPDTRIYYPGDSIYISGMAQAFAGMQLKGADVQIDASLNLFSNNVFKYRFTSRKIHVATVNKTLDSEGKFSWSLLSLRFPESSFSQAAYEFLVKVRDINGETREVYHRLLISNTPVRAEVSGPEIIDRREGGSWLIDVKSPGGRFVDTDLIVKVAALNNPDRRELPFPLAKPDIWVVNRKEWEKRFPRIPYKPTNVEDSIRCFFTEDSYQVSKGKFLYNPDLRKWANGRYRLIICSTYQPDQIIGQHEFDIYDSRRKDFPVRDPLWIDVDKAEYQPGDKLDIHMGSRYPGLYLLELCGMDTVYQREWIALGNTRRRHCLPITHDMLGNISISLSGVYENNLFSKGQLVRVPRLDKDLLVSGLDSIGPMAPGEEAKLNFRVSDKQGNPIHIEGVFTIYDASLDEIYQHHWNRIEWPKLSFIKRRSGENGFGLTISRLVQRPIIPFKSVESETEPVLNWFGLNYYGIRNLGDREMAMEPVGEMVKTARMDGAEGEGELFMVKEDRIDLGSELLVVDENQEELSSPPYFRKDFRETAYFSSNISTDKEGRASINFEVPDAISKWNIKLFGHDGDLAQVLANYEMQSRKSMMLIPNLPRFVRGGDDIGLSVKLIYNGTKSISAIANIRIENPMDSGKTILEQNQEIKIDPGDQRSINWNIQVPEGVPYLQLYFSVAGGEYKDGISQGIPVLAKELSFWDADNFFMGDESSVIISSKPRLERAVLELNTQPLWLAVQAMPVFDDQELECSEYWFSRFFTASLVDQITESYSGIPERLKVFAGEALKDSNLNTFLRNSEMRRFSLEAGLWDGADRNESARLMKLAESFTPDFNQKERARSLNKLAGLQLADGSWPWFRGMRPDFGMTLHILGGMGELIDRGDKTLMQNPDFYKMVSSAIFSVDRTVYDRYNRFRINHPGEDAPVTSEIIFYLYVRSFFKDIEFRDKCEESWSHYLSKSGDNWLDRSISEQAFLAISYLREGEKKIPRLVFNSLVERKIESGDGAIFWKINSGLSAWQERDIWQQSRVIELFNIIPEGKKYLDGLKTWLIMQKRSRDWSDRISTGLAVKSIILYGSDWYPASPDIRIESKGENFSPLRINLGTDAGGYYRYTWEEGEMLDDGLELKIQKGGKTPVWGSLYEKSSMDIDTLLPSGSDLLIRRIFLVEKEQNGHKGWLATSGEDLEVGSRIKIRLEIEASQAVDYVQIRDYRPASFEPDKSLSGYHWGRGFSWYQNQGDLYTDFYIHRLSKGFSFFEYDFYVEQKGDFSKGYTEIQSQYAPEFMARSAGGRIIVR